MTIELNDEIRAELSRLAARRGQTEREIIQNAIEHYIAEALAYDDVITDPVERAAILEAAAGMWKDRTDIPDVREMREGWEKRLARLFGTDDSSSGNPAPDEEVPHERRRPREFGSGAGGIVMSDDFDNPLDDFKNDQ